MNATKTSHREIPFNYTSADDRQALTHLLGDGMWEKLESLRARRVTGRSARLLMRVVVEVIAATRALLDDLKRELAGMPAARARTLAALAPIVGKENVLFDPFALVSHATDATDWRLHLPFEIGRAHV